MGSREVLKLSEKQRLEVGRRILYRVINTLLYAADAVGDEGARREHRYGKSDKITHLLELLERFEMFRKKRIPGWVAKQLVDWLQSGVHGGVLAQHGGHLGFASCRPGLKTPTIYQNLN